MSDVPLATVVVPFFDSEETIAACIDSLRRQQGVEGGYEIILVDNGSRDSSAEIARSREGVTVIEERTPGAYAARNAGVAIAGGPVIAFTDADCAVDSDWLQQIVTGMEDPRTGISIGFCRYPAAASPALRLVERWENAKADYVVSRCLPAHHFAYCNNMAVRASVFKEIGLFKQWRRAADTELVHRLAASGSGSRLVYDPGMRVTHLEFVRSSQRARRLSLYRQTNARIATFRELGLARRLGVLGHLVRGALASW